MRLTLMDEKKENFFENNLFRYDSFSCHCDEDTFHEAVGHEPIKTLKIQSMPNQPVRFAFAAQDGLIRLAHTGSIEEKNILASLISLPNRNLSAVFNFFKKNGFFFPVSNYEYEAIDAATIQELINRIKATVRLMSAIGAIRKNYQEILHLTLYLLLSEPVSLQMQSLMHPYITCQHPFKTELEKASSLQDIDRGQEAFDNDTYTIVDTLYPPTYEIDINEYNDIIAGYNTSIPGADDYRYKNIVFLYSNALNVAPSIRFIVDFLFHYQHDVGIIREIDYESGLDYYTDPDYSKFDNSMKRALIDIAKIVISEEVNSNLDGIHPQYNVTKLSPSWKVDSLMGAIYFSIFYMKPDLELYRRCENPTCNNYFLVKSTSTRNKYCSSECCNRASQSRYRKKKREEKENL
ncbi:CGNR zinc finger domain-containing protein [Clostridium botulinum]|nr:CGNR zinc finger domain-containing protein [Clostridium botulinum]